MGRKTGYLNQIDFVNSGIAYCVGEEGLILKSGNSGNNWALLNSGMTGGIYSLCFLNENTGWVCGDSGKILKTTNGGDNFFFLNSGSQKYISGVSFTDENTGWYASGEKKIFKTTDGGESWWVPHSNVFNSGVGNVQFVNANTGIGFTFDNKILLSSNGGIDWNEVSIPSGNYLNNIFASDWQNFWAVGDFGFIFRSTNGGQNWFQETNNNFDGRLFGIHLTDNNNGWIAGTGGMIVKYTNQISNIVTNNNLNELKSYNLNQNYPNPFNPKTIINYQCSMFNDVSLKVYDVLGHEVAVLVNEKQSPGTYQVEFDGSNFASGVYFYQLKAADFVVTKKMNLLK